MTFSYIRDLDEIVRFIHANNLSLPAQTLPHALLLEADRHSCSQTREWEGMDSSLPSSILASVMHAMPFRAWAPCASHKLKCAWKVSRFPQTPFQREWFFSVKHVCSRYIFWQALSLKIYRRIEQVNREQFPTPFWRIFVNNLLTSDAGTGLPIHGTQPGDSGSEGFLSLQTTFPQSPRITAAPSVHWLCQTPKI